MPSLLFNLLLILPAIAAAQAVPIRYDHIPADATGYINIDFERLLASRAFRDSGESNSMGKQIEAAIGRHADFAMYTPKTGGPGGFVMLVYRSAPSLRKGIETSIASNDNSVEFTYGKRAIRYTPLSAINLLYSISSPQKSEAIEKAGKPAKPTSGSFTLGLGGSNQVGQNFATGPCYVTFIDADIILIAGDVPAIAGAIEVIEGRKLSLEKQDPLGLKVEPSPGVIAVGAGLTAQLTGKYPEQETANHPHGTATAGNNFSFDLFGSFKGKANLARFDLGEDDRTLYVDALFAMKDSDSAIQLSNLLSGMKALIYLSRAGTKQLLDPVEIKTNQKDVKLRWTWPTATLPNLFRLLDQQNTPPATAPSDPKPR